MTRRMVQKVGYAVLLISAFVSFSALVFIVLDILFKGQSKLNIDFILGFPRNGVSDGGILPAIIGTTYVTLVCALFAIPLSVAAAIYLSEYAENNAWTRLVRSSIRNLAGVPSIVFGLFGLVLFVQALAMGTSILASGLTLGLMSIPYVITAAEEALKTVPNSAKEGAIALGATKWETIYNVSLPMSMPGIITGVILALSRAAGETAPILFTGVFFYQRYLPASVTDEFMALPYHLFILSTQHHDIEGVQDMAYGTALILLVLVLSLNLGAFIIRAKYRKALHR